MSGGLDAVRHQAHILGFLTRKEPHYPYAGLRA